MVSTLQSSMNLPSFTPGGGSSYESSPPGGLDDDDEDDDRKPAAKPSQKQDNNNNSTMDQNDSSAKTAEVSLIGQQQQQQQQPVQLNETASTASSSSSSDQNSTTADVAILEQQSTEHNTATTTRIAETAATNDDSLSVLRDLVSKESQEMRSRNKAILFRLFAKHDNKNLNRLAKDCKVPCLESLLMDDKKHDTKSHASENDCQDDDDNEGLLSSSSMIASGSSSTANSMAFMPQAIAAFIDDARQQQLSPQQHLLALPVRRSHVASKQVADLESETRSWHLSSNNNQHGSNIINGNGDGNDIRSSSSSSNRGIRTYALHFTECSVTSIARWTAMYSGGGGAQQQQLSNNNNINNESLSGTGTAARETSAAGTTTTLDNFHSRPFTPTADVRFRKCGLCRTWGHFEVECPTQTSHQRLRFARAIIKGKGAASSSSSSLLPEETAKNPSTNNADRNDTVIEAEKKEEEGEAVVVDEVSIEKCMGFLVEQRKEPRVVADSARIQRNANKRKREEFKRDEEVTDVDGLLIKATSTCPITARNEPEPLFEGDIVAWFDESSSSSTGKRRVFVGVIVSRQKDAINAKVRCLRIIPPEGPVSGRTSYVPVQSLTLLKNLNDDAEAAISSSPSNPSILSQMRRRRGRVKHA